GCVAYLETLEKGAREEILVALAERNILGVPLREIVARTEWLESEVRAAAEKLTLTKQVRIVALEPLIVLSENAFADICEKLLARVERFHKENPLLPGIAREELRVSLGKRVRPESFRTALEALVQEKKLVLHAEFVEKPGAGITLTLEEERAKQQIEQTFAKAGLAAPLAKEVFAQLAIEKARAEKLLQILLREKVLVRVSPELIFHAAALERLPALLRTTRRRRASELVCQPSRNSLESHVSMRYRYSNTSIGSGSRAGQGTSVLSYKRRKQRRPRLAEQAGVRSLAE